MEKPLVSVCMLTYNHEMFIRNAIDSVLMQKTDFPYELIIGEDCSTDKTREIVKQLESKNPGIIIGQYPSLNRGMTNNFISVKQAARGKYIAFCEGDDYWTDPLKLQKQIEFLESRPEYVASGHESLTLNDDGTKYKKQFYLDQTKKETLSTDYFLTNIPFHLSSLVINQHKFDFNNIKNTLLFRDHPLMIVLSYHGKIKIHHEVMSVYRKHQGGFSSNTTVKLVYQANLATINGLQEFLPNFRIKANYMRGQWHLYYLLNNKQLNLLKKLELYSKFFVFSFYRFPKNIKKIFSGFYRAFLST